MSLSRLVPAQQRLGTHQLLNYSPVHSCHRQSPLAQPISAFQQTTNTPPPTQTAQQALSVALLGSLWLLGRPAAPAHAGVIRPPQHLETVVSIAPQASAATSVAHESDNCAMLVGVCLGFYMLSATVTACIGTVLKLAGKPLAYSSGGGGAGWSTAGVEDTLDIMTLPLDYEDEPVGVNGGAARASRDNVRYIPWEGPDGYLPVSMVKVFQPGLQEAGRVARRSLLETEGISNLSIVSVTRPADDSTASKLLGSNGGSTGNGSKGNGSNGNGSSNGSNGNGSNGNGSSKKQQEEDGST